MSDPITILIEENEFFLLSTYSALDIFFNLKDPGVYYINTEASLITLAKLFDHLEYPGEPLVDAAVCNNGKYYFFRCVDEVKTTDEIPFTVLQLLYDPVKKRFYDPRGIYRDIRAAELKETPYISPAENLLTETAKLISRYHYKYDKELLNRISLNFDFSADLQKDLIVSILQGENAPEGFEFLNQIGFIKKWWPEIYSMTKVEHTKDYHPEGDVWVHTLETLKHRKTMDLTLSLALLFHDIGKPVANGTIEKPFDGHSQLGATVAAQFLGRLGFSGELIKDVCFLIRFHMMPFMIPKLPTYRTEKLMASPLFPTLLEVYRADLLSSFWGPEGYYEACRVYRSYLKNKKNPYRKSDGSVGLQYRRD